MKDSGLENKIVFITGGANGIGRGIVTAFCHAGADVIFCDTDEETAIQLSNDLHEHKCGFIKADVSNIGELGNAVNTVIDKKGNIDIIINNAGISRFGSLFDVSVDEFDHVMNTNLRPIFITSKILGKHRSLNESFNNYGRIINIASTRYLMSEPDSEAYAASKGGIVSITHALAVSLCKYNITVNCLSPGWIHTGDASELRAIDHEQHPSGRVGTVDDIAKACLFLCQPGNNFINGQNIVIDGGMTKKMIYEE